MDFVKMQGLGNDFVLVDCLESGLKPEDIRARAVALCDRRFGIGSDGVVIVCPPESAEADLKMVFYNPDSSEGMCGNGLRCFAKYAYESGRLPRDHFRVETIGGVVDIALEVEVGQGEDFGAAAGIVHAVRVDMGPPHLTRQELPMLGLPSERVVDELLAVGDQEFRVTCVSMGNPHCVVFVDSVFDTPVESWGPQIEHHPAFPERTNVEFVQVMAPDRLKVRVWERGAGVTLACGTGACASVVAGSLAGRSSRRATVELPGGSLSIEWTEHDHVLMTGPAETVFSGKIGL